MSDAPKDPSRRSRRSTTTAPGWADSAPAFLPLLACFLGGATQKWAEGVVVAFLGLLLIARPPRFSLGIVLNGIVAALVATAATAFLPARWFFQPAWRQALANDFGLVLPATLSPQPWLSLGAFLSLIAGLAWLYYVVTQELDVRAVRHQLRVFAAGVALLAALAIALYLLGTTLPFWVNQRGFGPFPNRNQTADLLGIAAVVILACGQDDLRQGRKRWIFWVAALGAVIAAVVLNFSRAGIAILIAGSGLWLASFVFRRGSGARLAVGASALLALLTVLLMFGGKTLERFNLRGDGPGITSDFRWLIFQDAWQLIRASPWSGIGLGNFEPVFAIFRDASFGQSKALHPESDWLWLASEVGWLAVLLVVAASALFLWRMFPMSEGTNQRFRLAAMIGALLFGLHGLVDVSGHRVGTAYAGLFLLGLALKRPLPFQTSAWVPVVFRVLGAILLLIGCAWAYAGLSGVSLPGGIGADNERRLATEANQRQDFTATIAHANRGLAWAPLDWRLYFLRALGTVGANGAPGAALDDFRRARFLEPNSFEVPYQEGVAWLTRQPALAMTAWREALRRAGPERADLYDRMLSSASLSNRTFNRMLEQFGSSQPDLALAYLERVKGEPFTAAVNRLLEHDPALETLRDEERVRLFELWTERGDLAQLTAFIEAHTAQLPLAWRGVAKHRVAQQDFRTAFQLARQFGKTPSLPERLTGSSIEELQRAMYSSQNNYGAGYTLYDEQLRAGNLEDALTTLRHFTDAAGAPAYFHFLEAEAWAAKGNWDRAWAAWQAYERAAAK